MTPHIWYCQQTLERDRLPAALDVGPRWDTLEPVDGLPSYDGSGGGEGGDVWPAGSPSTALVELAA
jgi:hypothetical protein